MKRLHVHVGVDDLAASIRFYSALFAAAPGVTKPDYAKWTLDDPHLNFAISTGRAGRGIEHLGIEAQSAPELAEVYERLRAAGRPILEEGATTCCYAESEKSWIADPQGVVWEAFHTTGEATHYGGSPALASIAPDQAACCLPTTVEADPRAACCDAASAGAEPERAAACCG